MKIGTKASMIAVILIISCDNPDVVEDYGRNIQTPPGDECIPDKVTEYDRAQGENLIDRNLIFKIKPEDQPRVFERGAGRSAFEVLPQDWPEYELSAAPGQKWLALTVDGYFGIYEHDSMENFYNNWPVMAVYFSATKKVGTAIATAHFTVPDNFLKSEFYIFVRVPNEANQFGYDCTTF